MPEITITLPCRIGDKAYGIRNVAHFKKRVNAGVISEMYFTEDMELIAVLKGLCRGPIGKTIFVTREEAERAIEGETASNGQ